MSSAAAKTAKSWTRRKQARPGEILEAALAVFAEKGFAAARMDDIAARAGVTKGTIYLYFPSKEEVFKSLARQHVGDTLSQAVALAAQYEGSVREFLSMMMNIMAEKIERGQMAVLPKIIIAESGNFPELARFWRTEVIDKALGMLSAVLVKGIERGQIRDLPADVPVDYVARLCVAPFIMSVIWRTVIGPTDTEPFDYRKFLFLHLDILLRGLAPEGPKS
jgi:AcrR family transcriptional regulator